MLDLQANCVGTAMTSQSHRESSAAGKRFLKRERVEGGSEKKSWKVKNKEDKFTSNFDCAAGQKP